MIRVCVYMHCADLYGKMHTAAALVTGGVEDISFPQSESKSPFVERKHDAKRKKYTHANH